MSEQTANPASEAVVNAVMQRLFADPALSTFVVLDGAAIPGLLPKIEEEAPEYECLYRGELEPDLAECAPYIVQLTSDSAFTRWAIAEGWGNHWGIFVLAAADINTLRRHFRGFLLVMSPEGKRLYFRYYDPRVLRIFLPTCANDELVGFFGPIAVYLAEDEKAETVAEFRFDGEKLHQTRPNSTEGQEA